MDFVFVDEQYGTGERGPYTAISAAIFNKDVIHEYRNEFALKYVKILELKKKKGGSAFVHTQLPVLHGSDLLPGYADNQKMQVLELICNLIKKYNVRFIRLGYYDKSLSFMKDCSSAKRVSFCISNLELMFKDYFSNNYAIVYELDKGNLGKIQYNDMVNINIYAQTQNPDINLSIDVSSCVGKFFCEKENYCMYASDIVGWMLKKTLSTPSAKFSKEVVSVAQKIQNNVLLNKIIFATTTP